MHYCVSSKGVLVKAHSYGCHSSVWVVQNSAAVKDRRCRSSRSQTYGERVVLDSAVQYNNAGLQSCADGSICTLNTQVFDCDGAVRSTGYVHNI